MTRNPTHIVFDAAGAGYLFYKDANGELFTATTAKQFAYKRNGELKSPTYRVLLVTAVGYTPAPKAPSIREKMETYRGRA